MPAPASLGGALGYLRVHRGQRFASTTAVAPMTEAFVRNIAIADRSSLRSARSLRTGLAVISPRAINVNLPVARSIRAAEAALKHLVRSGKNRGIKT